MSTSRRSRLAVWWWELSVRVGPNLWVVPLLMSMGALVLFAGTRRLDGAFGDDTSHLPEFLVTHNPADAALILTALLAAVGTALALVFSTSVLTLSLAQSQLGPRLIRRFMRDPVTQVTLGAFLATLIFLVLTLASNRTGDAAGVPEYSVLTSVLLTFGCFGLLVLFVHRIASTIQSPNVVAGVVSDLSRALDELDGHQPALRRCPDTALVAATAERARRDGAAIVSPVSGYIDLVDHARLVDAAEAADAVLVLERRPGQFVVSGQPLARVLPADAAPLVERAVAESVEIGSARTLRQDVEFAIAQVVEIAMRALSPAINDTYTGLTCVDWLGDALVRLGRRPVDSGGWSDGEGVLRMVLYEPTFERTLRAAFDLIRQSGADNPAVLIRMLDALASMAPMVEPSHRPALQHQADLVVETARAQSFVSGDLADVDARYQRTLAALGS